MLWIVAQLLVGAAGISIMTAIAFYRSWSRRIEKSVHGHAGHPVEAFDAFGNSMDGSLAAF